MEKKLAKITRASLEIKERGILNFWIHVDYEEGTCQAVGGIALDSYDETLKMRVGTAYGCEIIRRLLLALDVDDFSEMKGRHIWVHGIGAGLSFETKGIQKLRTDDGDDEAVIFSQIFDEMKAAQ